MNGLEAYYGPIKALHIIALIAWMAGLLYLPRLFVYHTAAAPGSVQSETFKVMERRLLRAITTPAGIAVAVFGGLLVLMPGVADWGQGWVWVKYACVGGLYAVHGFLAQCVRAFAEDRNTFGATAYRVINEVPTVLMIVIVFMVVTKPF